MTAKQPQIRTQAGNHDSLPDREERALRVQAIKERIRCGEYAPDVRDVAYLLATMMTPR